MKILYFLLLMLNFIIIIIQTLKINRKAACLFEKPFMLNNPEKIFVSDIVPALKASGKSEYFVFCFVPSSSKINLTKKKFKNFLIVSHFIVVHFVNAYEKRC